MWFEKSGVIFVSLPGVPYEMKGIMNDHVFTKLQEQFGISELVHRTVLTHGIGESFLADIIEDWENQLRENGLDMAYLPSPGLVKLRVTSTAGNKKLVDEFCDKLYQLIPQYIFGEGKITLDLPLSYYINQK